MSPISFRLKVIVTWTASVLVVVFIAFAAGSLYVNHLQRRNVEAAVELAQDQARQIRKDLLALLAAEEGGMSAPGFRAGARTITSVAVKLNRNIEWAIIVDSEGNKIVQTARGDETAFRTLKDGEHKTDIPLPDGGTGQILVETRSKGGSEVHESIDKDGRSVGSIVLKLKDTPVFQNIEATSRQITRALALGTVLLLAFLLLVFWVLWRLFTKQIHLTEANAELDRMAYVGTLASGLAHEIRNPLSAMNVNLEVLQEELVAAGEPRDGTAGEIASRVQREVQQLNETLRSFLDFALPRREDFTHFTLRGVLEDLIEAHGEEMRKAGVAVVLESPPASETAMDGDRRTVHQALRNILVNAVQAVQGSVKKQVRIVVGPAGDAMLAARIEDSGPGIDADKLDKIFEVFFTTRKGGSGFGLAIARKVAQEHHGIIRAENRADAQGAAITMVFPRVQKG